MKSRKIISIVVSCIMVTMLFTGCVKKQDTSSDTGNSTENTNQPTEKKEQVTLTFVRTGTPEVLRGIFEPIIADFEKENPDIKIDMQDLGWGDAEKSLQVWASSKTLPDVMYHLPGTIFDLASKGLVVDVNQYMDEELKNNIYESLLQAGQYDGKQYVIPCGATSLLLWYNTDIFTKAGLDPEHPPKTFEELIAAAKAITEKAGVPGFGMYAKPAGGETSFVFESLFAAASGKNSWDAEKQKYSYDDPENKDAAVSALKLMQDLVPYTQQGIVEYGRFDTRTLLRDGQVGMVLDAINMANQIPDELDSGKIKVAQIPTGASGKQLSAINMGGWFIPSNSKYPEQAWRFLNYLMKTENQIKHTEYGSVPILKSESETYKGDYWKTIIKSVEDSVPEGISPKTNSLWTVNGEELQLLVMGKQTPEETVENMAKRHEEIYSK